MEEEKRPHYHEHPVRNDDGSPIVYSHVHEHEGPHVHTLYPGVDHPWAEPPEKETPGA